ncbi:MAG: GGDEF domain-containing response regulator [Lautropia sp.]|nr:GGDEF domain-containing response regulator [Lautropia sp.]
MLVEDDPAWQHLISVGLGERGIDVQVTDQLAKAIPLLERVMPDAVMVDDSLSDADGVQSVRHLREAIGSRQIPIMVLSNHNDEVGIAKALSAGATDYFQKSPQWTQLAERLLHGINLVKSQAAPEPGRQDNETPVRDCVADSLDAIRTQREQANRDPLTGLFGRAGFVQQGELLLRRRRPAGHVAAIMMLDIDRFRSINETFGQRTGDEVLQHVASTLKYAFRNLSIADPAGNPDDVVPDLMIGRLSGDEYALIFSNLPNEETARKAAEIVQAHLRKPVHIEVHGLDLMLRASVGAAWFPKHGRNFEILLAKANVAMTVARQQGGNRFLIYDDTYGEQLRGDFEVQSALTTVLDRNELVLHYQPILDSRTGRVMGVEALMRWMRGAQMLSPDKFIRLAEDSGLDFKMGEWAISEALQQLRRWQLSGVNIPAVSVNVNVRHLQQPCLLRAVKHALEATGISPSALTLEVTEAEVMRNIESTLPALRALKKVGVRIALDDFGRGFSSVEFLTRMPIDVLKIDRKFVSRMGTEESSMKVVRCIIALAGALDLQVIGEGVEQETELAALQKLGCQHLQGYLFTKPQTAENLESWIHENQKQFGLHRAVGSTVD